MKPLRDSFDRLIEDLHDRIARVAARPSISDFGRVDRVGDSVAFVSGLADARLNEILIFENGVRGLAIALDEHRIGAIILDVNTPVAAGMRVYTTNSVVKVPVGSGLLGRIVDPLGRPLDGEPEVIPETLALIERPAPAIIDRDFITEPVTTGILAVDSMVPLGRGQRELVIGDRATGKTTLAIDAIINQRRSDIVCVYVAIGQKMSAVRQAVEAVRAGGAFDRTVFVVAGADASPGLQWIAPYCACAMAEYFRDRGGHALLVIDDLTKHANIHRQLSLLLRDSPGREAFPGDIFYMHARLLERAAKLSAARGGGSLSALAIAETQAGDISAYIPTNLISITDGQIYLDTHLFAGDQKPAIDIGKSVSRVGGRAQPPAIKALCGSLKLDYAQFLELEIFTRFGQLSDSHTRQQVARGQRIRAMLRQPQWQPLSIAAQAALLIAIGKKLLDPVPLEALAALRATLDPALARDFPDLVARVEASRSLPPGDLDVLERWTREFFATAATATGSHDAAVH